MTRRTLKGLFRRKEKDPVIGFDVTFEPNGKVYSYQDNEVRFTERMNDRMMLRGDAPHSIIAVRRSGLRETVTLS